MQLDNYGEILIYQSEDGLTNIEVKMQDETVWLPQQQMADLFQTSRTNIVERIKHIYAEDELDEVSTCRKFRQVRTEGNRKVSRELPYYNLDMIISLGYRVKSKIATNFRRWATERLKEYMIKGFTMDDERLKNGGSVLTVEYFDRLLEQIREIRLSERRFYQKITDIYATALDYDRTAKTTKQFFAKVQNKMHYAVHGHTAAEVIVERADHRKENMGLQTWKNAPDGKIVKADVSIAKNLTKQSTEQTFDLFCTLFLSSAIISKEEYYELR